MRVDTVFILSTYGQTSKSNNMADKSALEKLLEKISKLSSSGVNSEAVAELKELAEEVKAGTEEKGEEE